MNGILSHIKVRKFLPGRRQNKQTNYKNIFTICVKSHLVISVKPAIIIIVRRGTPTAKAPRTVDDRAGAD